MKTYRHYSFDLWLTLIKSNPEFKRKRAEYFYSNFNRNNKTIEEVENIIKEIDKMSNRVNEIIGGNINAYEMYAMVLYKLGYYDLTNVSQRDIISLYHYCHQMFLQYPPVPYDENTIRVLAKLKSEGATVSILSNTGFIMSCTLRQLLKDIGIAKYIDFDIYSDEAGMSKPNSKLFASLLLTINSYRKFNPVQTDEIVHIGDNPVADYQGAKNSGINAILINSNEKTIKDIFLQ